MGTTVNAQKNSDSDYVLAVKEYVTYSIRTHTLD